MNHSCGGIIVLKGDAKSLEDCFTCLVTGVKNVNTVKSGGTFGYSYPKGHLEGNEGVIDAMKREIEEECGIKPEQYQVLMKFPSITVSNRENRIITLFLCLVHVKNEKDDNISTLIPSKPEETVLAQWIKISDLMEDKYPIKSSMDSIFKEQYTVIERLIFANSN